MTDYLKLKNVIALGGSWLATKELISNKNLTAIYNNVIEAMKIVKEYNDENKELHFIPGAATLAVFENRN